MPFFFSDALASPSIRDECQKIQARCYGQIASKWLENRANWREIPSFHVNECATKVKPQCRDFAICKKTGPLDFVADMKLQNGQLFKSQNLNCIDHPHIPNPKDNPFYPDVGVIQQECQPPDSYPWKSEVYIDEDDLTPKLFYCAENGRFFNVKLRGIFKEEKQETDHQCLIIFADGGHKPIPEGGAVAWGEDQTNVCFFVEGQNSPSKGQTKKLCFKKFKNDSKRCVLEFEIR